VVISHASIPSSGKILSQTLNRFRKVLAIASATKTPLSPCCQQAFEQFVKIVYCQVTRSVVFLRDLLVDDLIENQELLKKVRFSLKYPDVAPELTWANQRLNIARDEMAQNYRLYVTNEFLTGPVPNLRQSLFNALTSMHKIDALHKQAYLQLIESMKEPNRHHYVSGEVIRLLKKVYFNMDDLSVNSKIFVGYYPVLVKVGKLVKALDAPCNEATTIFRNLAQKGIAEGQRKLQELPRPTPEQRMLSGIDRLNTGFHIHQRILEETETEANLQDATQASKPPGKFKQTITKVTNAVMKATGFIPKMMGVKMHNKRDTIGSALGQAVVGYTVLKNHKDNKKTDALLETMANDNIARQLVLHGMSRMNSGLHQIDLQIKQLNARTAALAESMSKNIDSKSAYDEQDASSKMTRI